MDPGQRRLSVLLIEDSESDVDLILRHLKKAGYEVSHRRIETGEEMKESLREEPWDLIISDYRLPHFDAPSAFAIVQQSGLDIPFMVVSGSIGEAKAVELMRLGVHDFILKDRLTTLGLAVERTLSGAADRRKRREAEEALEESEARYRGLVELSGCIVITTDRGGKITFLNNFGRAFFGYRADEIIGKDVRLLVPATEEGGRNLNAMVTDILNDPDGFTENINENILRDGKRVWVSWRNSALRNADGQIMGALAIGQDVTKQRLTERALLKEQRCFRALFENGIDGMMVTRVDGTVVAANEQMCKMLGMTEEEIVRAGRRGIVVEDDNLRAGLEERVRTGRFHGELTLRRKDGSLFPVELSSITFPDTDGALLTCQVVRDISERKRWERSVQEAYDGLERRVVEETALAQRQADLLDLAQDAIIVWNDGGTISFWNSGAEKTYGFSRKEATGDNIHTLLRSEYSTPFETIMETIEREGRWEGEIVHTCRMGNKIVALSRWASRRSPVDGDLEIMEVNRDITGRKLAEEALRAAGTYNRSLIEASLDPLVTIDASGRISDANRATEEVTGYPREALIGTDFARYFVDPKKAKAGYKRAFREGFVRDFELEVRHRDGMVMPVLYNATVFRDREGRIKGVFAAARDVTAHKRAEQEIIEKSKALEEVNTALKVLLDYRKKDQQDLEESVLSNMRNRVIPYLDKIKGTRLDPGQAGLIDIVERALLDITSPFLRAMIREVPRLTQKEIQIVSLIREGKTTKEIALILGVGKRTIDSHRDAIRNKLKITDKHVNLRAYLLSLSIETVT